MVETCSVTAADCPCLVFPYIERTGQGLRPAVGGLFSFPLKIHFKAASYPLDGDFSKISFALVIRATGFWQPAGREFFLSLPTTPAYPSWTETGIFRFVLYYGQKSKMPNAGAKKISLSLTTTIRTGQNGRERSRATKKAANLFQTYCFYWPRRWRLVFCFEGSGRLAR